MKTNKIIAFILSVIFIFSINVTGFAAEEETATFEPGLHAEALNMLSSLGITDELIFDADTSVYVTRGEFAKLAALLGAIPPLESFEDTFSDVSDEHDFANYIYAMKNAGYMSGVSAELFLPDEPVYFEQAVSVLVKLLGYGDLAIVKGGYPAGFISIATQNDLFDGIEPTIGAPLLKADLLVLLKNTALCEVLLPVVYGSSVEYQTQEGVDLLAYNHKIYHGTGIVEADAIYTMTQERALEGKVVIDGYTYIKADDDVLKNYVGRKVEFFYKGTGNQKTIYYAAKYNVKEIFFVADGSLSFDLASRTYTFEDEKTYTYRIGNNYKVIYNTAELYPITEDRMLPASGTVTLINNDEDSVYEVIIVDEYINIVAGAYNESLDKVDDLLDSTRTIRFKDYESYSLINSKGAATAKSKIKQNDIIEFYESADGKAFTAIVTTSGLEVTFDAMDNQYLYSGDQKYGIAADIRENINSITLGNKYVVYENSKGELVYWTRGNDFAVAYVVDVKGNANGFDSNASVKLYTEKGQMIIKPLAEKITNVTTVGTTYSSASLKRTDYATIFPKNNHRELIAFKENENGEITTVYHAMPLATLEEFRNPPQYPLYSLDYYLGQGIDENIWSYRYNMQKLLTRSSTFIIAPPASVTDYDESIFAIKSSARDVFYDTGRSGYLIPTAYNGSAQSMMPYMVGNSYPIVTHVMIHDSYAGPSAPDGANDLMVSDIRYVYDTEAKENQVILVGTNGITSKEYVLPSEAVLKRDSFINAKFYNAAVSLIHPEKQEIKVGDIVALSTDPAGKVKELVLLYDREHNINTGVTTNNRHVTHGTVDFVGNNAIAVIGKSGISIDNPSSTSTYNGLCHYSLSSVGIWVFDKDLSRNYAGTAQDIEVGDEVHIVGWSSGINSIAVYKN